MNKSLNGNNKRTHRRKKKRHFVHIYLILSSVVLIGCFLLGAKRVTEKTDISFITGIPTNQLKQTSDISETENFEEASRIEKTVTNKNEQASSDWNLILVNPWNTIPNEYNVQLIQLKNGQAVDKRCYSSLQNMIDDCREEGLNPVICSSYRSQEKQERLFNNEVNRLLSKGYSKEKAELEAGKAVAVPGTSEHQLGLAVDIVDLANQNLDESQENTSVQKWLMKNSWKYGFILRYPNKKSDITGIIYEPWHYRYVGKEAAKEIYEQDICLEEYLEQL